MKNVKKKIVRTTKKKNYQEANELKKRAMSRIIGLKTKT